MILGIVFIIVHFFPISDERYNMEVIDLAYKINNISLYFVNYTDENLGVALYLSSYISKKFKVDNQITKSIQTSEKVYFLNEYLLNIDNLVDNIRAKSKEIINEQNMTKEEANIFVAQVGESSGKGFFVYQTLKGEKIIQITDFMVSLSSNQTFKNDYENLKKNVTELENKAFDISGDIGKEIFPTLMKSKIVIEDDILPILNDLLVNLQELSVNQTNSKESLSQ